MATTQEHKWKNFPFVSSIYCVHSRYGMQVEANFREKSVSQVTWYNDMIVHFVWRKFQK